MSRLLWKYQSESESEDHAKSRALISTVSSAEQTRAQRERRTTRQMAILNILALGPPDITTKEFISKQKRDESLKNAFKRVGELETKEGLKL